MTKLRIVYHGTGEKQAKSILREGFRAGTWFASHLEDALEFGGVHVFEAVVEVDKMPPPDENERDLWQFWIRTPWPPDKIVSYKVYTVDTQVNDEELRERVFQSNVM